MSSRGSKSHTKLGISQVAIFLGLGRGGGGGGGENGFCRGETHYSW